MGLKVGSKVLLINRGIFDMTITCLQSHCHIMKELHDFLCMMGAITIFGKNSFIFNFEGYELVTKSLRDWVHI